MKELWRRFTASLGWWDAFTTPGPKRLLAINALVDATGKGVASVVFPFYVVLTASLSPTRLALVMSLSGVCELVATVPNGVVATKLGIRLFSITSRSIQGLVFCALPFTRGFAGILVLGLVGGVARAGGRGLHQSLTVAILGEGERAPMLGAIRALRNIGYMLSGAIGAALLAANSSVALRGGLFLGGLSLLFSAYCVVLLKPRKVVLDQRESDWSVLRDWEYFGLIISAAVFGSSLVILDVGLPLWAVEHSSIPKPMIGVIVAVNTIMVVLLQYRFSQRTSDVHSATKAIVRSAGAFGVGVLLLAMSSSISGFLVVAVLLLAAVFMTFGELYESPAWWTVSYDLAPADRKNEYLSAFDLSTAVVIIAGPLAMAVVVAAGATGWIVYGGVFLLAAGFGRTLIQRRARRMVLPVGSENVVLPDVVSTAGDA